MALPKRRHSSTRQAKRRTHYKLVAPALSTCPSCGAVVVPHRACRSCGQYRRRLVIPEGQRAKKD